MAALATIGKYAGTLLVVVAGVVLAAVIVATGPEVAPEEGARGVAFVETMRAAPQRVRMTVTTHGTVVPKTESHLVSEVSGRIVSVAPSMVSGGFFARGDVLVEIERVDYEAALQQARANAASATGELRNAERAYERRRELIENRSISVAQRDDALTRLTVARATLQDAAARVARAERDLERTRLVAPYDGRVRTERVDPGQFVNRGESVATLYSIDLAEVRLPVHDDDLAFLPLSLAKAGDAARQTPMVTLRARFAGAERAWQGRVVRTEGELDPKTRMVNVIVQVPDPYEQAGGRPPLTVGLFVEAEILGNEYDGIVALPRTALQGGNRVYVADADDRLAFRDVTILRIVGDTVYVSGGLREGDEVCLDALGDAIEGQHVRPSPVES